MTETPKPVTITFRCPTSLNRSIEQQGKATKQNKTDVLLDLLFGSIPNVKIIERYKLPPQPAIYFVYTPDHRLLYLGKADNLQKRWNSHHRYQSFIETSVDCRIGYFTLENSEALDEVVEELQKEATSTPNEVSLATAGQLNELRQELYGLKRQFDITFAGLSQFGLENFMKKFETLTPPKGLQSWEPNNEERREGIIKSNLMKRFGFSSMTDLENAASFYNLSPEGYLEELSGWECRPVKEGSSLTRFFEKKSR